MLKFRSPGYPRRPVWLESYVYGHITFGAEKMADLQSRPIATPCITTIHIRVMDFMYLVTILICNQVLTCTEWFLFPFSFFVVMTLTLSKQHGRNTVIRALSLHNYENEKWYTVQHFDDSYRIAEWIPNIMKPKLERSAKKTEVKGSDWQSELKLHHTSLLSPAGNLC